MDADLDTGAKRVCPEGEAQDAPSQPARRVRIGLSRSAPRPAKPGDRRRRRGSAATVPSIEPPTRGFSVRCSQSVSLTGLNQMDFHPVHHFPPHLLRHAPPRLRNTRRYRGNVSESPPMLIAFRIASSKSSAAMKLRIASGTVPWQVSCCLLQNFACLEPLPFEGLDG